jgi:serine protease AprX
LSKQLTVLFFLSIFSITAQNVKPNPKLSADLAVGDGQAASDIIVQWKQKPTEVQHQKVLSRGGTLHRGFSNVSSAAYSLPSSELSALANDADVVFITPDRPVHAKLDYSAAAVNASTAWNSGLNGAGIGIALIDSGVNSNADLNGRIVYSQDFTSSTSSSNSGGLLGLSLLPLTPLAVAPDLFGHGEHVAGIMAGNGTSSNCLLCDRHLIGIAPGANIVNLRVLDENGVGTDSEVIAAIDQAISLAHSYNIRVINLSLGRPVYESYTLDPLCQAVEQAWKAGIVVVVAAGNDGRDNSFGTNGYGTISAPGNDPYVITVGAMKTMGTYTRTDDLIASYSSKGPTMVDSIVKPDVVAPGNQVVSLLASTSATLVTQNSANNMPMSYYQYLGLSLPANTFFKLSGTSMATPVVSGAAALLLQANPAMTPDQVKARLMLTAYKTFPASSVATDPTTGLSYLSYYDIFTVGAGYVDIAAALASKALANGTALSPTAVYNSSTGSIGIVTDSSSVWGTSSVWGVSSVWGNSSVSGTSSVWGTSTVWGNSSVWGTRCVWGANVNAATTRRMTDGVAQPPSSSSVNQSTSLSISIKGEN